LPTFWSANTDPVRLTFAFQLVAEPRGVMAATPFLGVEPMCSKGAAGVDQAAAEGEREDGTVSRGIPVREPAGISRERGQPAPEDEPRSREQALELAADVDRARVGRDRIRDVVGERGLRRPGGDLSGRGVELRDVVPGLALHVAEAPGYEKRLTAVGDRGHAAVQT
jgi:hypothetical protein